MCIISTHQQCQQATVAGRGIKASASFLLVKKSVQSVKKDILCSPSNPRSAAKCCVPVQLTRRMATVGVHANVISDSCNMPWPCSRRAEAHRLQ